MEKSSLGLTVSEFLFMAEMAMSYLRPMQTTHSKNLNKTQLSILRELRANNKMNLSQLATVASVTNQAMTTISNQLVKQGFIERIYNENNRRQIEIQLTKTGLDYVNETEDEVVSVVSQIFSGLSEADLNALHKSSREIYAILEKTTFGEKYGNKKEFEEARRKRYTNT